MNTAESTSLFMRLSEQIGGLIPPDSLLAHQSYLELPNWQWLLLITLLLIALIVERITAAILKRIAQRLAGRSEVKLNEAQLHRFVRPLGMIAGWSAFLVIFPILGVGVAHPLTRAPVTRPDTPPASRSSFTYKWTRPPPGRDPILHGCSCVHAARTVARRTDSYPRRRWPPGPNAPTAP